MRRTSRPASAANAAVLGVTAAELGEEADGDGGCHRGGPGTEGMPQAEPQHPPEGGEPSGVEEQRGEQLSAAHRQGHIEEPPRSVGEGDVLAPVHPLGRSHGQTGRPARVDPRRRSGDPRHREDAQGDRKSRGVERCGASSEAGAVHSGRGAFTATTSIWPPRTRHAKGSAR